MRDEPDEKGRVAVVVAVVDDDLAVLESISDLLSSVGHIPRPFASASAFLQSGVLETVDCLVSDIRMPGMDGWHLQSLVHKLRPGLPVIMITAFAETERSGRHPSCEPARLLLRKPFDGQQLLAAVEASLKAQPHVGSARKP